MDENLKLLVLEVEGSPRGRSREFRTDRSEALNAISASGVKVRHDSGGRLIVIEATEETEKALTGRLSGIRLVPVDADVRNSIADLDSTESLFLAALKIRTSKLYRDAKRRRKVGETPEEKALVSGPCVREDY
jgi:hypothetical protein